MNSRELVKAVFRGQQVARCGYWTGKPHEDTWPQLLSYFGISDREELFRILGDDIRWINLPAPRDRIRIRATDEPVGRGFLQDADDPGILEAYYWTDPDEVDLQPVLNALEQAGEFYRLTGCLSMFFHGDCFQAFGGMEGYFVKMHTSPELVRAFTGKANDYYLSLNRRFFTEAGRLADGLFLSHDLGSQLNILISPGLLEDFVFPYLKAQVVLAHAFKLDAVLHCCGAISDLIPRLIELGVDALHPIQALAAGMDARSLQAFKGQIAFIGGIDTQQLLVSGSPEEIREEVRRVSAILGPMIISPSHEAILPNIPARNLEVVSRTVYDKT